MLRKVWLCFQNSWKLMNPTEPGRNKDCPATAEAYERVSASRCVHFPCHSCLFQAWQTLKHVFHRRCDPCGMHWPCFLLPCQVIGDVKGHEVGTVKMDQVNTCVQLLSQHTGRTGKHINKRNWLTFWVLHPGCHWVPLSAYTEQCSATTECYCLPKMSDARLPPSDARLPPSDAWLPLSATICLHWAMLGHHWLPLSAYAEQWSAAIEHHCLHMLSNAWPPLIATVCLCWAVLG